MGAAPRSALILSASTDRFTEPLMPARKTTRRNFFKSSTLGVTGGLVLPGAFVSTSMGYQKPTSANETLGVGVVGLRY